MKTFTKKWLCDIGVLALCTMLAGCGKHEHTWAEATCTTPKTCSECEETEGEPLGHSWVDATCTSPKTCSRCDATEGEPLGHQLSEANYQQPATCSVCGATEGEPLQADFDKYGLVCNAELNVPRAFVTECYSNKECTTTGEVVFYDYEIFESDETHEAVDGYEWRAVTCKMTFDDKNAWDYGFASADTMLDYYDIFTQSSVNYNGQEFTETYIDKDVLCDQWDNSGVYTKISRFYSRAPIGYDGTVIVLADGKCRDAYNENGNNIAESATENTIFFRMDLDADDLDSTEEAVTQEDTSADNSDSADTKEVLEEKASADSEEQSQDVSASVKDANVTPDAEKSEEVSPVTEQSNEAVNNAATSQSTNAEVAFNGEPILQRGTNVTGYDCILADAKYQGFSIDDCYKTASGTYVVSGNYVCKFFDNTGNGTHGQYVLWGIGDGNPNKYIGGENSPIEGVHYWVLQ